MSAYNIPKELSHDIEQEIQVKKSINFSYVSSNLSSGVKGFPKSSIIYPFPKSHKTTGKALIYDFSL